MTIRTTSAALGVMTALLSSTALAQETLNLTVISGNAPQFAAVHAVTKGFIPAVNEILAKTGKYKISWNEAYSGQIAKPRGELEALESGLGDVGVVISAYTPDKLPLHQVSFMTPFASDDIRAQVGAMNHMLETFEPFKAEWASFNQVALRASAVVDAYTIYSRVPLESLADMKGKKIAAVGANLPWVEAAGAAAVTGEMSTAYNSIQTGVYDGMLLWQQIAAGLKICEPGSHALQTGAGGSPTVMLNVNLDVWQGLPDEVKAAFEAAALEWDKVAMETLLQGSKAGLEACERDFKQKTVALSDEERSAWAKAMPNMAKAWAERAEAAGAPGKEMLGSYMDFLRSNGQTVLRDWDKE